MSLIIVILNFAIKNMEWVWLCNVCVWTESVCKWAWNVSVFKWECTVMLWAWVFLWVRFITDCLSVHEQCCGARVQWWCVGGPGEITDNFLPKPKSCMVIYCSKKTKLHKQYTLLIMYMGCTCIINSHKLALPKAKHKTYHNKTKRTCSIYKVDTLHYMCLQPIVCLEFYFCCFNFCSQLQGPAER